MKSKAYRATAVNRVDADQVSHSHPGQALTVGFDIGKYRVLTVGRWPDAQFERPWLVTYPEQVRLVGPAPATGPGPRRDGGPGALRHLWRSATASRHRCRPDR